MGREEAAVSLPGKMLVKLDAMAREKRTSRAAVLRDAVATYLELETEAEKDRRLIEGYTRFPPDEPWLGEWAMQAARGLVEEEPW